ncbi:hypothetical protein BJY22_006220 [Kribbella shirazensis]|uniref:Uncharacterized protein n=1 Tax=Kribbella shirazensis TaxID=1105143 RepID=A0A7X5VI06_9ACTN|nr:hypothetical protein [Kribbella shirazensis]
MADWAAEFARTGEVRIAPRRRVAGVRMLFPTFLLVSALVVIVLALLGRRDWLWLPLFCVVAAPSFIAQIWPQTRMLLFGQPILIVDTLGVSLGRNALPGTRFRSSRDQARSVGGRLIRGGRCVLISNGSMS